MRNIHIRPTSLKQSNMCLSITLGLRSFKNLTVKTAVMIWLVLPSTGSAKFIDFDELDPVYDDRYACWCDNPLSDEYADWGAVDP